MNDRARPRVLGLGEVLWDCFEDGKRPGGAPSNFAYHTRQMGCDGRICSRIGRDALGDELLAWLEQKGLPTDSIQRDPAHATGTVTVDATDPTSPQYVIHENVAWDHMQADDDWTALASDAAYICFGSLAQRSDDSRAAIHRVIGSAPASTMIVCDVNLRQNYYSADVLESSFRLANLVKLNEAEVVTIGELLGWETSPAAFAQRLADQFDVQAICVTRGADGCLLHERDGETVDVAGVPVEVRDAVGAGDAFTAAWIVGRLRGLDLEHQAKLANRIGGYVASCDGAMPPLADQFERLTENIMQL